MKLIRANGWVFLIEAYGGSYFYTYGLAHAPLAIGATLSSLAPILSVPVAIALKLEKFSPIRTLGVCLAVLGLIKIMYIG
jgi:drug/metabolite transporter (DMT)-like permease